MNRSALSATAVATTTGLGSLWFMASLGWPGTPVDCLQLFCYCEASVPGLWRQPVNTWSNLAPVLVAFVVALDAGRPQNAALPKFLHIAFPITLVFQGVGSMFFHASLVDWAGAVDAMSMFAIVGLLIGINLLRAGVLAPQRAFAFWVAFSLGGMTLGLVAGHVVGQVMGLMLVVVMGTEVWLHRKHRALPKRWFRIGMAVYLVGVVVWYGSAVEGAPLCDPHSVWQGHALWHVTSGAAIGSFWLHARENLIGSAHVGVGVIAGQTAR